MTLHKMIEQLLSTVKLTEEQKASLSQGPSGSYEPEDIAAAAAEVLALKQKGDINAIIRLYKKLKPIIQDTSTRVVTDEPYGPDGKTEFTYKEWLELHKNEEPVTVKARIISPLLDSDGNIKTKD